MLPLTDNVHSPDTSNAAITRTAFDIFSTCASTVLLCAWCTVHAEVPMRRRIRWALAGVLVPPWLLYRAAVRLVSAVQLLTAVYSEAGRDVLPLPEGWVYRKIFLKRYFKRTDEEFPLDPSRSGSKTVPARVHPWTLSHAFYAVAGGYVLDTSEATTTEHCGRYVLTPRGVVWLLQHAPALIPDVPESALACTSHTRTTADPLLRLLALSQVLYFCVSCLDRGVKGLPLSLLEVVTLAHVLCIAVAHIIWRKKPRSIAEPTVIAGSSDIMEGAAMFLLAHTPDEYLCPPAPAPSPDDESHAPPTAPYLTRDSSAHTELTLFERICSLDACMALYALPLYLLWGPGDANACWLWRGAVMGLLAVNLLAAVGVPRIFEPRIVARVSRGLEYNMLVECALCVGIVVLRGLTQLRELPPLVLQRTTTFRYWPHFS